MVETESSRRKRRVSPGPLGARHGLSIPAPRTLEGNCATREKPNSSASRNPGLTCSSSAAAKAGIALGARFAPARRAHNHRREERPLPVISWRNRYINRSACTTRSGTTHFALHRLPEETGRCFSPKDKIGDWLEMYTKVMEAELLDRHRGQARRLGRCQQVNGTVTVERRWQGDHAQAEAAGVCDRHVPLSRTCRDWFNGHGHLQGGSSTIPRAHPGPDRYKGKKVGS